MNDCQTCSPAGATAHRQWSPAAVSRRLFRGLATRRKFISNGRKAPTEMGGARRAHRALAPHAAAAPMPSVEMPLPAPRAAGTTNPTGVPTNIAWLDGPAYLSTNIPHSRTCCNHRLIYVFTLSRVDRLARRAALSASSEKRRKADGLPQSAPKKGPRTKRGPSVGRKRPKRAYGTTRQGGGTSCRTAQLCSLATKNQMENFKPLNQLKWPWLARPAACRWHRSIPRRSKAARQTRPAALSPWRARPLRG